MRSQLDNASERAKTMSSAMILPAEITDLRRPCVGPPGPHALRIFTAFGDLGLTARGDLAVIGFDDTGYGR